MIAAIHPLSRSFKVPIKYVEVGREDRQSRVAWAETYNLPTRDLELAACFMGATANGSVSGTRTPVYFSVSFDIDDPVDEAMMGRVARRTLRDMGLEEHEAVVVAHKDRSHPHLHFIVNRVHPTRFVLWRKWWDYGRMERSLRAQEVELWLRVVPGRHAPVPHAGPRARGTHGGLAAGSAVDQAAAGSQARRSRLQDVTERAAPILAQVRSWAALESGLAEQGLALTVKGGGFRITDGKHQVKGSEVGRAFSRYHLEKRLGAYPDYRARMAVADMGPVPPVRRIVVAPPSIRPKRIPQFNELFGAAPARGAERPAVGVVPELAPTPVRGSARFLKQVRAQAGPVLKHANTWEELERGLARHGLTLRAKGGGFVLTDGAQEVKASDVGRAFSGSHLKKRLDRRSEDAAPAIEAAAPPAPAVLPATPTLPRESAPQTIAATPRHADLDEQHQPVRSTRTPQFGDAGHGIADLFRDPLRHQREQTGPDLERAPGLQPRAPESHETVPAGADAVPVAAETLLEVTTAAPSMAEAPELGQTAEPVREEVGTAKPADIPAATNKMEVAPVAELPQRPTRKRVRSKTDGQQVDLWSAAPEDVPVASPEQADAALDELPPAMVETPEIVSGTPQNPVSPRPPAPASARELVQAAELVREEVPAAATADHNPSAQSELAARIEQLRRKVSVRSLGETLTGAAPTRAVDNAPPREVEPVREEVEAEVPRLSIGTRSTDAEAFVQLAECCQELKDRIEQAEGTRARMEKLSGDLGRVDRDVRGATASFANEIKLTFRNPKAFYD